MASKAILSFKDENLMSLPTYAFRMMPLHDTT